MAEAVVGLLCSACAFILVAGLFMSFTTMSATQMALQYNTLFQTVDPTVIMTPGVKFIGPFSRLMVYPKTAQNLEYLHSMGDQLNSRTNDGLPLSLDITVTYQLIPDGVYKLYTGYENSVGDYRRTVKLIGHHVLTEEATKYSAYEFFNEKNKIAEKMRVVLDQYFRDNLYAYVTSLQINSDKLPNEFRDAITEAATRKQAIQRTENYLNATIVKFQTDRLVARAQASVKIQKAEGQKHRIEQNGKADAAVIAAYVKAELEAYARMHTDMNLNGDHLIDYIYYDTLAGGGVAGSSGSKGDVSMFVGVDPAAYISQYKPTA
eukprot:TRINITY_DN74269_c0_g1_i1.p1 TRINITY_DN74269_c0_g1~~TRINITY_DN74269_c0_g1_i1.p1  ORF type:complete len:320 (-),score=76.24 TRINITY_DN74269_c0_g1_i1:156-1115(-)